MSISDYWPAKWVWLKHDDLQMIRRCVFRRVFELPAEGVVKIHVSADSRYRLYLDGNDIGEGPAAGDLMHYNYESYGFDHPIKLPPGRHVLSAQVLSYRRVGPMNEIHCTPGFVVEGVVADDKGATLADLRTPGDWRVCDDPSFGVELGQGGAQGYWALGFSERIDLSRSPGNWSALDYDDSAWTQPVAIGSALLNESVFVTISPWILEPRPVPMMERTPQRFGSVVRTSGPTDPAEWSSLIKPNSDSPITIAPRSTVTVILDQGELTTAYPCLNFVGGKGSSIKLTYAEAFVSKEGRKEKRDDHEGREIRGFCDFISPSGKPHQYQPIRWRTFRFIQIDIVTTDEPLVLSQLSSIFTAYPFKLGASFQSDQSFLDRLWPLCWRTARLCAHETYMDCPYYEQLQYVGDTLIQALISCVLTGDTRLFARAIRDFDNSRLSIGLTQSRYPSRDPQVIATFSLIYVQMVEHYFNQTGDTVLTREVLPGLTGIIDWYMKQVRDPQGLIEPTKWWSFVDWTSSWGTGDPTRGKWSEPFEIKPGSSTIVNLQLVGAMQSLARLHDRLGDPALARTLRARAKQFQQTINRACWSSQRNLYADTPQGESFSEHANLLAILTDTATATRQQQLATTLRRYPLQTRAGYYFEFYLALAYTKLGRVNDVLDRLEDWKDILDLGLTTMPEAPHRIGSSRSDCHAWSAWPAWWTLTGILGIGPDSPGYASIRIEPRLGRLQFASGTAMTPRGPVMLSIRNQGGALSITGRTPDATACKIVLPGGKVIEHSGGELTSI